MMNQIEIRRFPAMDYPSVEAMNTLCTNLTFSGEGIRKVMVTSCQSAEGKSFMCMNMVRTLAGWGKKVALLDLDLRRSVISAKFNLGIVRGEDYGITHYLAGMCEMQDVIFETNVPNLQLIPVRHAVKNSLPLLHSSKLPKLLNYLASQNDYVIVDVPPVGVIIDAAEIAKYCDGTLFVVGYNRVSRRELSEAKHQIECTGCDVLGAVLNNVPADSYSNKKYYYKSYYSKYGRRSYAYAYGPEANTSGRMKVDEH